MFCPISFQAIWENQFYYLFGFLFLVFVILCISVSQISIVMVYFQLCGEVKLFQVQYICYICQRFLVINSTFNPFPHTADQQQMTLKRSRQIYGKIHHKWMNNYWMELISLWQMEKLLIMSNFPFATMISKVVRFRGVSIEPGQLSHLLCPTQYCRLLYSTFLSWFYKNWLWTHSF